MSRDFEFRQLLRAYRSGIISEAAFEQEMICLENGNSAANGSGFRVFGRTYRSERDAIISFLDKARAAEHTAGIALPKWAAVCKTECIRSGLRMIGEREAYHARVFEQRVRELGGEIRAGLTEEGRQYIEYVANPDIPDNQKLLRFASRLSDPKEAVRPIVEFIELIKDDVETKEMLRLFCQDELSSTTWLLESCKALNPSAKPEAASASI